MKRLLRLIPESMSERSISSDCTPMLLLKALLQEDPLTSKSKSTGSKGELYRPYLREKRQTTMRVQAFQTDLEKTARKLVFSCKTHASTASEMEALIFATLSAAAPRVESGDPAAGERWTSAGRRRLYCSQQGPPPSHSSATQSTSRWNLEPEGTRHDCYSITARTKANRGSVVQLLTTCCSSRQVRHIVKKSLQEACTKALLTWGSFPTAVLKNKSNCSLSTQCTNKNALLLIKEK